MPDVVLDGVRIVYDVAGEGGVPILLLHEFAATKDQWAAQVAHFAPARRVIAPNAVGFPPSDVPRDPAAYSIERQVANAVGLLRHLGEPRAHIVGHSMGAHTGLELALRHPDVAASVTIVGGGSGQTNRAAFRENCFKKADELERQGMAALGSYEHSRTRRRFEVRDPAGHDAYFSAARRNHSPLGKANTLRGFQATRPSWYEQEAELRRMQVPVLVIVGDEDEPCVAPGVFLKKVVPRCGLCVVPMAGHTVQVEAAAEVNRALDAFVRDVDAGGWAELTGFTDDAFTNSMAAPSKL